MKDYYAILGVVPSAEDVVIRAAWKALVQRYHPDRCAENMAEANARMSEINEAYNVLSDPVQRKAYDQSRGNKESDFSEWEHEEAVGRAAGSFDPLEKDWALAVGFYPDLVAINNHLSKISNLLAFTYRASLLDLKEFENRKEIAEIAENLFLESYFGSNPTIIAFARRLIYAGNKAAAKALNNAIRVLGSGIPADRVINKICKDFNVETEEMQKRREWQESQVKQAEAEAVKRDAEREKRLIESISLGVRLSANEIYFLKNRGINIETGERVIGSGIGNRVKICKDFNLSKPIEPIVFTEFEKKIFAKHRNGERLNLNEVEFLRLQGIKASL